MVLALILSMTSTLKTKLAKLNSAQLTTIGAKAMDKVWERRHIQSAATERLARVVFVAAELVARRA